MRVGRGLNPPPAHSREPAYACTMYQPSVTSVVIAHLPRAPIWDAPRSSAGRGSRKARRRARAGGLRKAKPPKAKANECSASCESGTRTCDRHRQQAAEQR